MDHYEDRDEEEEESNEDEDDDVQEQQTGVRAASYSVPPLVDKKVVTFKGHMNHHEWNADTDFLGVACFQCRYVLCSQQYFRSQHYTCSGTIIQSSHTSLSKSETTCECKTTKHFRSVNRPRSECSIDEQDGTLVMSSQIHTSCACL